VLQKLQEEISKPSFKHGLLRQRKITSWYVSVYTGNEFAKEWIPIQEWLKDKQT